MDALAGKQMEPEILSSRRPQSAWSQLSVILHVILGSLFRLPRCLIALAQLLWPYCPKLSWGERTRGAVSGAENTQTSYPGHWGQKLAWLGWGHWCGVHKRGEMRVQQGETLQNPHFLYQDYLLTISHSLGFFPFCWHLLLGDRKHSAFFQASSAAIYLPGELQLCSASLILSFSWTHLFHLSPLASTPVRKDLPRPCLFQTLLWACSPNPLALTSTGFSIKHLSVNLTPVPMFISKDGAARTKRE